MKPVQKDPPKTQKSNTLSKAFVVEGDGAQDVHEHDIDRVRNILFGSYTEEQREQFSRLESRVRKELSNIKQDVSLRFDTLEKYVKQELSSLALELKKEETERKEESQETLAHTKKEHENLKQKIKENSEQGSKSVGEVRQLILERSKHLSNEIRRVYEDITNDTAKELDTLRHQKTDRTQLANLFGDMVVRLNPPKKKK